jgi:hypothetical protein
MADSFAIHLYKITSFEMAIISWFYDIESSTFFIVSSFVMPPWILKIILRSHFVSRKLCHVTS